MDTLRLEIYFLCWGICILILHYLFYVIINLCRCVLRMLPVIVPVDAKSLYKTFTTARKCDIFHWPPRPYMQKMHSFKWSQKDLTWKRSLRGLCASFRRFILFCACQKSVHSRRQYQFLRRMMSKKCILSVQSMTPWFLNAFRSAISPTNIDMPFWKHSGILWSNGMMSTLGGVRNFAEQRRLLWRRIAWSERILNEFCAVVYGGLFGFVRRAREKKWTLTGNVFFLSQINGRRLTIRQRHVIWVNPYVSHIKRFGISLAWEKVMSEKLPDGVPSSYRCFARAYRLYWISAFLMFSFMRTDFWDQWVGRTIT